MALAPTEFTAEDNLVRYTENKPFICRPDNYTTGTAALLVHGFTGTPWEMAPLARHLAKKGITSVAVRLPGHGTTPEDLAQKKYEEWVEVVSQGQQFLKKEHTKIVAIGLSTGALISLEAHLSNNFTALVLLSPYLKTRHPLAPMVGLLRHIIRFQKRKSTPDEERYYYNMRPLEGIYQINRLIRHIKTKLQEITVPALVTCSEGDLTIDPKSAVDLYNQLGSQIKELHTYGKDVPHVVTTNANPRQEELFALVSYFIENSISEPNR
jgi:carboxylesterase